MSARRCHECGWLVTVRPDGRLSHHESIESPRAWFCPGSDTYPVTTDPEWRSWVHHVPNTAAEFLTAGTAYRCFGCDAPAAMFLPYGTRSCIRCGNGFCPELGDRPLLGFPPYEREFAPSPICAALMRRAS